MASKCLAAVQHGLIFKPSCSLTVMHIEFISKANVFVDVWDFYVILKKSQIYLVPLNDHWVCIVYVAVIRGENMLECIYLPETWYCDSRFLEFNETLKSTDSFQYLTWLLRWVVWPVNVRSASKKLVLKPRSWVFATSNCHGLTHNHMLLR